MMGFDRTKALLMALLRRKAVEDSATPTQWRRPHRRKRQKTSSTASARRYGRTGLPLPPRWMRRHKSIKADLQALYGAMERRQDTIALRGIIKRFHKRHGRRSA